MVNISEWDASEYLDAAAQSDDPRLLQTALGDVAKARGMAQVDKDAGKPV